MFREGGCHPFYSHRPPGDNLHPHKPDDLWNLYPPLGHAALLLLPRPRGLVVCPPHKVIIPAPIHRPPPRFPVALEPPALSQIESGASPRCHFSGYGERGCGAHPVPRRQGPPHRWRGAYDSSFDIGEKVLTLYLWSKGVRRLHAVALSHPHPDHPAGLFAIYRNLPVE